MNPSAKHYETRYADAEPAPPVAAPSLLDVVIAATGDSAPTAERSAQPGRLDDFLREMDTATAVKLWLGEVPRQWARRVQGQTHPPA